MAQVTQLHMRGDAPHDQSSAERGDALWLQHVETEMLPPLDTVLRRSLVSTIQARTMSVGQQLSTHLLGTWGLRGELQRVRGVLLMASQAMHTWADRLCLALNQGAEFSDPEAAESALISLEQLFQADLEAAHATDPTEPDAAAVRLSCRALDSQTDENRLGLGNARSPSIQRSHLSQAAYIDVVYDVTWPLSIVISPNDLKRYRQCFPVLLQMHWVQHNLCRTSKALWNSRMDATDPFSIPVAVPSPTSTPARAPTAAAQALKLLTAASAADALHTMHHVVSIFQRVPLDALAAAWTDLQGALGDKASVDLDDICSLHARYLDRVQAACLLGTDRPSQVVAHALYQVLEIALQFTQAVMYVLHPTAGWQANPVALPRKQESPEVLHENRGNLRAAASKASRLSIRFKQEVQYVITLLCNPHMPTVAGTSTVHLLNLLNYNGYYNNIIEQERRKL